MFFSYTARSANLFKSAAPLTAAWILYTGQSICLPVTSAILVLPVPGGPTNIIESKDALSINDINNASGVVKCS